MDFEINELVQMEGLFSVGLFIFFCRSYGLPDLVAQNFSVDTSTGRENGVPSEKLVNR